MEFFIWHGMIVLGIMLISFGAGYFTALKQIQKDKSKVQKFTHW